MNIRINPLRVESPIFLGFGAEWDSRHYRAAGITDEDFALIRRRVEWMRLPVARLMMQVKWCRRDDGSYNFDSPPMQDLYRHLDVCEALGTTVFLTDWGCMPDWLRVPGIVDVGDPRYAEAIGVYLDHLVNTRGYRCLRYFIMVNEPNWEMKENFPLWRRGLEQVAQELGRRGLDRQIVLTGSDEAHAPDDNWYFMAVDQVAAVLGAYDVHRYASDAEVRPGALEGYFRRLWDYARDHDPHGAHKLCVVGEAGLGDDAQHPQGNRRINDFEYGLFMADYAVQAANAGSAAVLAWMLDDNSHPDFFWGMWSSKLDGLRLRPWFYPWALLCRLFPAGSRIQPVITGSADLRVLLAYTADGWACCAVNRGEDALSLSLKLETENQPMVVRNFRYSKDQALADGEGFPLPITTATQAAPSILLNCAPQSVSFWQAVRADDAGNTG